jgi:hypothetical protein
MAAAASAPDSKPRGRYQPPVVHLNGGKLGIQAGDISRVFGLFVGGGREWRGYCSLNSYRSQLVTLGGTGSRSRRQKIAMAPFAVVRVQPAA